MKKQILHSGIEVNGAVEQKQYTEAEIQALTIPQGMTSYLSDTQGRMWKCTAGKKEIVATSTEIEEKTADLSKHSQFSFVVDSDEAFAEWANNDRTKGQDYTSVLIKKGTWKINNAIVNVAVSQTYVIVGEPNSLLEFNADISLSDNKYCICNGVVGSSYKADFSFNYACNVTVKYSGTVAAYEKYAFAYLDNLYDCKAIIGSNLNKGRYGFYYCDNLLNCNAEILVAGTGTAYGFRKCDQLNNCGVLMHDDEYSTDAVRGYDACHYVFASYASVKSCSTATGFYGCYYLFSCRGTGQTTGENVHGYGFNDSRVLFGCGKYGEASSDGDFYSCYMDPTSARKFPVAFTAEGGYNGN